MNHPDRETWMTYLYDDGLDSTRRRELEIHLRQCAACRIQVQTWNQVRQLLNRVPSPAAIPRPVFSPNWVRWAAAAIVLIGVGIGLGRLYFSPDLSLEDLRAQLAPALREQVRQDLATALAAGLGGVTTNTVALAREDLQRWLTAYSSAQEAQRQQDLQTVYGALARLDRQRREDTAALRQDMLTVALATDAGFQRTRDHLVELAAYTSPTPAAPTP